MSRVLVVEDDALVASTIEIALVKAGYRVIIAKDGADALAIFDRTHPDAVLTDINLPRLNGVEVIKALRLRAPSLVIIAMSGSLRRKTCDVQTVALAAGATAILRKPFEKRELLDLLPSPAGPRVGGENRWSDFDFGVCDARSALSAIASISSGS